MASDVSPPARTPPAGRWAGQLQALDHLSLTLVRCRSGSEVCAALLDATIGSLDADGASIHLLDRKGMMRCRAGRGLSEAAREALEGYWPWPEGARDLQPVHTGDSNRTTLTRPLPPVVQREHAGGLAFFPVLGRQPLGVLMVWFDRPHRFVAQELRVGQLIARLGAGAIERARIEHTLGDARLAFQRIAEAAPGVIFIVDLDAGRTVHVSPGAEQMARGTAAEMAHAPDAIIMTVHPDDLTAVATHHEHLRSIADGEIYDYEYRGQAQDGNDRWWRCRATVFVRAPGGGVQQVIGIAQDVTGRREADAERETLLAREQASRRHAEEAVRSKDEFLALVSHELRSPLNSILGWTQTITSRGYDPELVARGLGVIERSARTQSRLVEDLLDLSRSVSGRLRVDMRPVNLAAVLDAAIEIVRPAAQAKDIAIRRRYDPGVDVVSGDAQRLQQVCWNLLSNAVKFTPRGGRVELRLRRCDPNIHLTVSDTGDGIGPELMPHVFDRFRQGAASTASRHDGLGLGLALVRQLVELHGGRVLVASEGIGKGATFTVQLPVRALRSAPPLRGARTSTPGSEQPGALPPAVPALQGRHVLVVDDDADARELLTLTLADSGAHVTAAASSSEAWRMLHVAPPGPHFEVLVSDIAMPDEDGYALIERVRQLPSALGGAIPAVAVTGYGRLEDRRGVLKAGYQAVLVKPTEPADLVRVITRLLS